VCNKLRVLFFLHSPNPFPGASWTRIEFFAEYLRKKGYKVAIAGSFSLFTLNKAGSVKWNGIRILNITPILMIQNLFSLMLNIVSSLVTSIPILILLRPEVVIISVPNGETGLGSYAMAKLFRIKKIVIDYRDEWEDYSINNASSRIYKRSCQYLKTVMTKCYMKSDFVITVTEPLAKSLHSRGIANVKIITNGADCNVFKPNGKEILRNKMGFNKNDFIIVYTGFIGAYYRLDVVIKALKIIIDKIPSVKLLLVGCGSDVEGVLNLANRIGLQNSVFYLGAKIDKMELGEILSASDVGIIPRDANPLWNNALPAKSLEYFACGLPVLATVHGDSLVARLIDENKIGLYSEPENVDALADTIEKIYNDNIFISDAGKRAALLIQERFDRNKIAEDFLNLLKNDC